MTLIALTDVKYPNKKSTNNEHNYISTMQKNRGTSGTVNMS